MAETERDTAMDAGAYTICDMPLRGKSIWIVAVSSMEQIIGAGLSTVIGVILPMYLLATHSQMAPTLQGVIGASGLVGIALGSTLIGKISDRQGYLRWFRICPILIIIGALMGWGLKSMPWLVGGLFIAGIGVGGGYSLDSVYIGELLPNKWRLVMVGVAKATCSLGFILVALLCWVIIDSDPNPKIWNNLMLIFVALGVVTLLMRIHWAESPKWLVEQGRIADAQKAAEKFFGKRVKIEPKQMEVSPSEAKEIGWIEMFKGDNLRKAILCGVPWACEGLGVYGFGVFLPALVMTLGLVDEGATGIHKIVNSVEITTIVNFFILPGFIIGLLIMNKMDHVKMLWMGFVLSAVGLVILYFGYTLALGAAVMIAGFIIYEVSLNAGPHLVTYILPSQVYPVADRGAGTGLAAATGKLGGILGVVIMPVLLHAGGAKLVLIVSAAVMLTGALVALIFRKEAN